MAAVLVQIPNISIVRGILLDSPPEGQCQFWEVCIFMVSFDFMLLSV